VDKKTLNRNVKNFIASNKTSEAISEIENFALDQELEEISKQITMKLFKKYCFKNIEV